MSSTARWLPALAALVAIPLVLGAELLLRPTPSQRTWSAVPDDWAVGMAAYEQGEFGDALRALTAAEQTLGDDAPPALLHARALAALRTDQLRVAESSADKLVARGGPELTAFRDFVLGSAAWVRCVRAGFEATQPEADPTAFDRAIGHAAAAARLFQAAALRADSDWPAARRNAERALAKLAELQREKERREQETRKEKDPEQPEPDPDQTEEIEEDPRLQDEPGLLSAAELQALLERLAEAEREKRAMRREAQRARSVAVEQDW